jgi:hypothetical protein
MMLMNVLPGTNETAGEAARSLGGVGTAAIGGLTANVTQVLQGGAPLGGAFTLTFKGAETELLNYDTSQFVLKASLEALPGVASVEVGQADHLDGGRSWVVTFFGDLGDQPLLVVNSSRLTGNGARVSVVETVRGKSLAGSFRVVEDATGAVTEPIPVGATAAGVKDRLSSHFGDISVTPRKDGMADFKGIDPASGLEHTFWQQTHTWEVTFKATERFGDQPLLRAIGSNVCRMVRPSGTVVWIGPMSECFRVAGKQDGVLPLGGTFTLSYRGATTVPIRANASAAELGAALAPALRAADNTTLDHVETLTDYVFKRQVNDRVFPLAGRKFAVYMRPSFNAPVFSKETESVYCIDPMKLDWDPTACPNAAPDLWLSYNKAYWPFYVTKPGNLGTAAHREKSLLACRNEAIARTPAGELAVRFACESDLVPESRPYCCANDPHGCQQNSGPPCWASKPGYDYEGEVHEWTVYDAIVTVQHRSDGRVTNYTRLDWEAPTLFKKGYRYWARCSSMEECVSNARASKRLRADGRELTGCSEVLGCVAVKEVIAPRVEELRCGTQSRSWGRLECVAPSVLDRLVRSPEWIGSPYEELVLGDPLYAPVAYYRMGDAAFTAEGKPNAKIANRGSLGDAAGGVLPAAVHLPEVQLVTVLPVFPNVTSPSVFSLNFTVKSGDYQEEQTTVLLNTMSSAKAIQKALEALPSVKSASLGGVTASIKVEQLTVRDKSGEKTVVDPESGIASCPEQWVGISSWRVTFTSLPGDVATLSPGMERPLCAARLPGGLLPTKNDPFKPWERAPLCCGNCSKPLAPPEVSCARRGKPHYGYHPACWLDPFGNPVGHRWKSEDFGHIPSTRAPFMTPCPCSDPSSVRVDTITEGEAATMVFERRGFSSKEEDASLGFAPHLPSHHRGIVVPFSPLLNTATFTAELWMRRTIGVDTWGTQRRRPHSALNPMGIYWEPLLSSVYASQTASFGYLLGINPCGYFESWLGVKGVTNATIRTAISCTTNATLPAHKLTMSVRPLGETTSGGGKLPEQGAGALWSVVTSPGRALNNTWQHVALRYDGHRQSIFVDGIHVASAPLPAAHFAPSLYSNLHIGHLRAPDATVNITGIPSGLEPRGGALFVGDLDELAVFPVAVAPSNIQRRALYNRDTPAAVSVGFGSRVRTPVGDYEPQFNVSESLTPYVHDVSPRVGAFAGAEIVVIGTRLLAIGPVQNNVTITVGNSLATQVLCKVVSTRVVYLLGTVTDQIKCVLPEAPRGILKVNLRVDTVSPGGRGGSEAVTRAYIDNRPTVFDIYPKQISAAGGVLLRIRGSGFVSSISAPPPSFFHHVSLTAGKDAGPAVPCRVEKVNAEGTELWCRTGSTLVDTAALSPYPGCHCSPTGNVAGGVATGRPGCGVHAEGQEPFCYVLDGASCNAEESSGIQTKASRAFTGAYYRSCTLPGTPPTDSTAEVVVTVKGVSARHVATPPVSLEVSQLQLPQQHVATLTVDFAVSATPVVERLCLQANSVESTGAVGAAHRRCVASRSCACSSTGKVSFAGAGDSPTELTVPVGCAVHANAKEGLYRPPATQTICYVQEPDTCVQGTFLSRAFQDAEDPSLRARWRVCDTSEESATVADRALLPLAAQGSNLTLTTRYTYVATHHVLGLPFTAPDAEGTTTSLGVKGAGRCVSTGTSTVVERAIQEFSFPHIPHNNMSAFALKVGKYRTPILSTSPLLVPLDEVRRAIEQLPGVGGEGSIELRRIPAMNVAHGLAWSVTFTAAVGDVPLMSVEVWNDTSTCVMTRQNNASLAGFLSSFERTAIAPDGAPIWPVAAQDNCTAAPEPAVIDAVEIRPGSVVTTVQCTIETCAGGSQPVGQIFKGTMNDPTNSSSSGGLPGNMGAAFVDASMAITCDSQMHDSTPRSSITQRGGPLRISGWGFSPELSDVLVTVGGEPCSLISSNHHEINCTVPPFELIQRIGVWTGQHDSNGGGSSGPTSVVTVDVGTSSLSNSKSFTCDHCSSCVTIDECCGDTFAFMYSDGSATVRRSDSSGGWGQELKLSCRSGLPGPVMKGSAGWETFGAQGSDLVHLGSYIYPDREGTTSSTAANTCTSRNALNKQGAVALGGNTRWRDYTFEVSVQAPERTIATIHVETRLECEQRATKPDIFDACSSPAAAEARRVKPTADDMIGVLIRHSSMGHFAFSMGPSSLRSNSTSAGCFRLTRVYKGATTVVNSTSSSSSTSFAGYNPQQWHRIRFSAISGHVQVIVDNETVLQGVDPTATGRVNTSSTSFASGTNVSDGSDSVLQSGRVGVMASAPGVRFKDARVVLGDALSTAAGVAAGVLSADEDGRFIERQIRVVVKSAVSGSASFSASSSSLRRAACTHVDGSRRLDTYCNFVYRTSWTPSDAAVPEITGVSPQVGGEGDKLDVMGVRFNGTWSSSGSSSGIAPYRVTVGDASCRVTSVASSVIRCVVPPNTAGDHIVAIEEVGGLGQISGPAVVFTHLLRVTIVRGTSFGETATTAAEGSYLGGRHISVQGDGFSGVSGENTVSVCGTRCLVASESTTMTKADDNHTVHSRIRCQTGSPFDFLSAASPNEQETTTNLTDGADDVEMVAGWRVSGDYFGVGVCDTFPTGKARLVDGPFVSQYEDTRDDCMRSCESTPTCTFFAYCNPVDASGTGTCDGKHRNRCELYNGCTRTGKKEPAMPISLSQSGSYCQGDGGVGVAIDVRDTTTAAECDKACEDRTHGSGVFAYSSRSGYFGFKLQVPTAASLCRCYTAPDAMSCVVTTGGALDLYTRSMTTGEGGYYTYRLGLVPTGTTDQIQRYEPVLNLKKGGVIGLRFRNVDVSRGATINTARVSLTAHSASDDGKLIVGVQAVQDFAHTSDDLDLTRLFANLSHIGGSGDTPELIQQRAKREVTWDVGEWRRTGFEEETVDIAAAVHAVVQSPRWRRGGTLVIILYGIEGAGVRHATAHHSTTGSGRVTHLQVASTPANVSEYLSNASSVRECNLTVQVSATRQLARCASSTNLARGRRVQARGPPQTSPSTKSVIPTEENLATLTDNHTVGGTLSPVVVIASPIDLFVPLGGDGGNGGPGRVERIRLWWETSAPPYEVSLLTAAAGNTWQWTTVHNAANGPTAGPAGPTDIMISSMRLVSSMMRIRIGNGAAAVDGTWVKLLEAAYYSGKADTSSLGGFAPLATGKFCRIKASYRSGYISCDGEKQSSPYNWNRCHDGSNAKTNRRYGFELKKGSDFVLKMSSREALPYQCTTPQSPTGDIVCNTQLSVATGDRLVPTWYDASRQSSITDNAGQLFIDLWGFAGPGCQSMNGGAARTLVVSLTSSYTSRKETSISVNGVQIITTGTSSRVIAARMHPVTGAKLETKSFSNPGQYHSGASLFKTWLTDTVKEGDIVLLSSSGCFYRTTSVIATWLEAIQTFDPSYESPSDYCSVWMLAGVKGAPGAATPPWFATLRQSQNYGLHVDMEKVVIPLGFGISKVEVQGCGTDPPEAALPRAFSYRKDRTPIVSAVSPASGTTAGNTLIEVRGQRFSTTAGHNTVYLMRNRALSSDNVNANGVNGIISGGSATTDSSIKISCEITYASRDVIKCLTGRVSIIDGGYSMVVVHVRGQGYAASPDARYRYIDKWSSRTTWGGLDPPQACGTWEEDKTCKNSVWIPNGMLWFVERVL